MFLPLSKRQAILLFVVLSAFCFNVIGQNKLSPEEIISKSLKAIGKTDATSERRMAIGGTANVVTPSLPAEVRPSAYAQVVKASAVGTTPR